MTLPVDMYIGDDWIFPIQLRDAGGNPIDLTGSEVRATFYILRPPVKSYALTTAVQANGFVLVSDPASGDFVVKVDRSVTGTILIGAFDPNVYTARLQVFVIDAVDDKKTYDVVLIRALDPRTVSDPYLLGLPANPITLTTAAQGPAGPPTDLQSGIITTGAPGSDVVATISGTAPDLVLNLQIPRGVQGFQGLKGDPGDVTIANIKAAFEASIANGDLPTTLPATAGKLWLNGGLIAVS